MSLHFSVCQKCKTFDYKVLIGELRTQYPNATFDLKCQSFCGPGSIRPFLAVNERFIEADTIEELLEKTRELVRGELC